MAIAKKQTQKIFQDQSDDSSHDEILRELAFKRMVDKGLSDVAEGNDISNDDMKNRIQSWQS